MKFAIATVFICVKLPIPRCNKLFDHGRKPDSAGEMTMFEGSLEAKLPTIWTVETQSREEAERREKIRRKKR